MNWERINFEGEEEFCYPIDKDCPVFTSDGNLATVLGVNGDQVSCVISTIAVTSGENDESKLHIIIGNIKSLQLVPIHPVALSLMRFFNEDF